MDKGFKSTKLGVDKSAENTPNAPKFICPSPKVWDFNDKRLHCASVVREPICTFVDEKVVRKMIQFTMG